MMSERPIRNNWCDRCKLAHSACGACGGLTDGGFDAHRASHHFCKAGSSTAPDEDRIYVEPRSVETMLQEIPEVWDSCLTCSGLWVRFGKGPRLDMRTHELHVCLTITPEPEKPPRMPDSPRQVSVEPPLRGAVLSRETKFL